MQQDIYEHVLNKQNDLWIDISNHDIKIGQRQDLNDYQLIHKECLRNFGMMGNIENPTHQKIQITKVPDR